MWPHLYLVDKQIFIEKPSYSALYVNTFECVFLYGLKEDYDGIKRSALYVI